ncbi:SPOR domain-containing protein [Leptothermofonsia sp. ETS-13]|uniref:SPOR domain-containing protein n=1 Tax=Leptothermofonsia sp. ETS-13 TaxID=3035696 RepID=UPI003BA01750
MRQFPKIESPAEVPAIQPLHPILSSALASLDIQLEEELARYRRMRVNPNRASRRTNRRSASKPLDLIRVAASGDGGFSPETVSPAIATLAQDGVDLQRVPPVNPPDRTADHSVSSPYSGDGAVIAPHLQTSDLAIAPQPPESPLASDPPNGTSLSQEQIEAIVKPLNPQSLDDYLESSEELLRSLTEEEAAVQAERGFVQSLLTPLGAGSMLLMLLSSAMFGYLVMNPSSVGRLFTAGNSGSGGAGSNQSIQTGMISPQPNLMISPQPNLAAQEFKDLNLNTLGTLKADSSVPRSPSNLTSSVTSSPAPKVPGQPTITSTRLGSAGSPGTATTGNQPPAPSAPLATRSEAAAPPRQVAPPVKTYEPPQSARTYAEPRQSTASTKPVSIPSKTRSYNPAPEVRKSTPVPPVGSSAEARSSSSFDRKVVTHYDSDRTLEEVKKVVPDAYVRNFPDGARIQLGAFTNEAEAEARVQQLRNQGISAEVYKP